MKCPYCGKEMEEGHFNSPTWDFTWTPKSKKAHSFRNHPKDYEIFKKKSRNNHVNRLTVYRCADCKKEIIDENDL